MTGHPSEHLLWAPDPRDDLAFTLYAQECTEIDELKNEIAHYLNTLDAPYLSVQDLIRDVGAIFPDATHILNIYDWTDLYKYQYGR